jgi:hypothetical protein
LQVLARAAVHVAELGDVGSRLHERACSLGVRGRSPQSVQIASHILEKRRDLRHPERDALAGGDVGVLSRAHVGERVGRLARVLIERAERLTALRDLLFGLDQEERCGGRHHPGHRAQGQSCRT